MSYFRPLLNAIAILAAIGLGSIAAPASAQATRTWVSGVGDDVNPCSRTAPCKTFAGAISKTAAGGEINCLDPGGFGAVTITKSMTISCPYTEGGALAGGNGITVNPPSNGVRFISQGSLHIEDTVIRRFNASNSFGISFKPTGAGRLFVNNVTIAENGSGGLGGGVTVEPTGAGTAQVVMQNVRLLNNANVAFRAITIAGNGPAGVNGLLDGITAYRTTGDGILLLAGAGAPATSLMVVNSGVAANTGAGLLASGSGATMRVAATNITANGTGVSAVSSSAIRTYGNNRNDGNTADGAFTLPIIPEE